MVACRKDDALDALVQSRASPAVRLRQGDDPWLVPCEPRSGTGAFLASIAISTNEHILEDSPLVKAQRAARMVNEMSMTSAEVGVSFGVSGQTIRNWTKLLELDHKVQKAVEAGQLKPTAAVQLHGLPAAEQREKLEALKESGDKVTVERARSAAKDPGGNGIKAPTKRIMRRVVEVSKVYGNDLSDDFLRGVRWAAGDLDSKSIKGLSAIMEEAAKRPRKQAE